jgi:hypothetical protein
MSSASAVGIGRIEFPRGMAYKTTGTIILDGSTGAGPVAVCSFPLDNETLIFSIFNTSSTGTTMSGTFRVFVEGVKH